jgi:hypoxanthine phosphoribosyltransferase
MASTSPVLISEIKIHQAVRRLARQIDRLARAQGIAQLTVVCVMDGAFIFCADLVRAMKTPTTIVFAKAQSYNGTKKGRTALAPLPNTLKGQTVLIVDTIYDTGKTIAKVIRAVRQQTCSITLVVLVEKRDKAKLKPRRGAVVPMRAPGLKTFVGFRLGGDPFLVGYGLDCSGQFRHLRDLRAFEPGSILMRGMWAMAKGAAGSRAV